MATEAVKASNRTIARAAANAAERYRDRVSVRWLEGGEWRELTFGRGLRDRRRDRARTGRASGLEPGDRVALLANTRPEWTFSSLAISRVGGVVVPIYPTNSPDECEWVLGNSDSRIVICEDAGQAAKIEQVRERLQQLEHVVVIEFDGFEERDLDRDAPRARRAVVTAPSSNAAATRSPPSDPYTIIYTSGTTGPPKGVVLSHGNCASVGVMVEEIGFVTEEDLTLSVPAAGSLVRADRAARLVRRRQRDRVLGRRPAADHRRADAGHADLLPVGPADLREALRAGAVDGRERAAAPRSAVEVGVKVRQLRGARRGRPG